MDETGADKHLESVIFLGRSLHVWLGSEIITIACRDRMSRQARKQSPPKAPQMLLWLLDHFAPLLEHLEVLTAGDSRIFLTARIALASLSAFLLSLMCGPIIIRWLNSKRSRPA